MRTEPFEGRFARLITIWIDGVQIDVDYWNMEDEPIQNPKSDIEENEPDEQ